MPAEPTLADVLASLATIRVETNTRFDSIANDSRARDVAQTERSVRLETKVDASVAALNAGLTTLNSELEKVKAAVPNIETAAKEAAAKADRAMGSHHDLQTESHAQWVSVMTRLDEQDKERDRIKIAEAEQRNQQSLAVKRMLDEKELNAQKAAAEKAKADADAAAEKEAKAKADAEERQAVTDRLKVLVPFYQAIGIAIIGAVVSYFAVRAGHQDTDAKLERQNQALSSLSLHLQSSPSATAASSTPPSWGAAAGSPEAAPAMPAAAPRAAPAAK